jgi:hypothetical protein
MYAPIPDQIRGAGPRVGMFYRRDAGSWSSIAHIAEVADRNSPVPVGTAQMVALIANSAWNKSHVRYGSQSYSAYSSMLAYKDEQGRGMGPQMEAKYGPDPLSGYGTGSGWPTLWIPTPDGREPEQVFGPPKFGVAPGIGTGGGAGAGVLTPIGGAPEGVFTPIGSGGSSAGSGQPPILGTGGSHGYVPPGGVANGNGVALAGAGSKWWMWGVAALGLTMVYFWQKGQKKKRSRRLSRSR